MKPVNLIPSESRRGIRGSGSRNVPVYAVVGVLVAVLGAVSLMAVFDGKIEDGEQEVASLTAQVADAEERAASLTEFTSFQQLHDARVATIDSLAKSRFDWERVMRELAIVIPKRVWLTNLTGTVTPGVTVNNGAGIAVRASAPGPALEMTGCARNQRTVARLISAMQDIDGVTRVLVPTSAKAEPTEAATESTSSDGAPQAASSGSQTGDCTARPSIATFELVAAFDDVVAQVPVPATAPPATEVPATTVPPATEVPATTAPPTASTDADGGVATAQQDAAAVDGEIAGATEDASQAANIVGGGDSR